VRTHTHTTSYIVSVEYTGKVQTDTLTLETHFHLMSLHLFTSFHQIYAGKILFVIILSVYDKRSASDSEAVVEKRWSQIHTHTHTHAGPALPGEQLGCRAGLHVGGERSGGKMSNKLSSLIVPMK